MRLELKYENSVSQRHTQYYHYNQIFLPPSVPITANYKTLIPVLFMLLQEPNKIYYLLLFNTTNKSSQIVCLVQTP